MPSVSDNVRVWGSEHHWKLDGDEWSNAARYCGADYSDWKHSLIESFLTPNTGPDRVALEVGCGHGRWTEHLAGKVKTLYLVDAALPCLDYCRTRFGQGPVYLHTHGAMPQVPDQSVDFVWSFDVFVHIDPLDIATYLAEFKRILKPTGVAVIHHANDHRHGGWRSQMTAAKMLEMAERAELSIARQTDCWGDRDQYNVKLHRDVISSIQPKGS